MEFESDRVWVESKSVRQYWPADLGHKCSIKLRVVAAVQAGKLERTDEKLEQQVGALVICTNTFTYTEADSDRVYPESVPVAQYSPADVAGREQFKIACRVQ